MTRAKESVNRFIVERERMVKYLRSRGIRNTEVLRAMGAVPRELFVRDIFQPRAYEDSALPIECNQTISQPYTVALMSELLAVERDDRILEVGTGSGYQAAVLSEMGARVFTIERHFELLELARRRFDLLRCSVASKVGDGSIGWTEFAPYDKIVVTAGAPEIPKSLLSQLTLQGRLVVPVGDESTQTMVVAIRREAEVEVTEYDGFRFVPLVGKEGWKR